MNPLVISILVTVILLIAMIVVASLITKAAVSIKTGEDLHQATAEKILKAGTILSWISVALVLIVGGLFDYYGSAAMLASGRGSTGAVAMSMFLILIFITNGALAAVVAFNLHRGVNAPANQVEFTRMIGVAAICLVAVGAAIGALIYQLVQRRKAVTENRKEYIATAILDQNQRNRELQKIQWGKSLQSVLASGKLSVDQTASLIQTLSAVM